MVLEDIPDMSSEALDVFLHNEIVIPIEVLAEVVYVLNKYYKIPREDIEFELRGLVSVIKNTEDIKIMQSALEMFSETKFDFVDCVLFYRQKYQGFEVFTFDKKLKNYIKSNLI
jgi:predicted nucleic-acid-binding protein